MRRARAGAFLLLAAAAGAATLPAGASIPVRLQTAVGSKSRVGTPVEAVVIAGPAAGAVVRGVVEEAKKKSKDQGRAVLQLRFSELAGVPVSAQVSSIDNARETVEGDGVIYGLRPMRRRPNKVEDVLILAAHAHPIALATLETAKLVLAHELRPEIEFRPGVEMRLTLARVVGFTPPARAKIASLPPGLGALVEAQPLRTRAARPPDPSDMTNLMFVGEEGAVRAAFQQAGWTTADATTIRTATETFLAVADRHSFRHAPVSLLLLDGAKPDLVFQKQNDTFAMRHHIRIWRRPQTWTGRPVWLAAATHDIGIVFSRTAHEFSHKVEGDIDVERTKVADDLCFTGSVRARGLVPRPLAPRTFTNATGDHLRTDGAVAVLILAGQVDAAVDRRELHVGGAAADRSFDTRPGAEAGAAHGQVEIARDASAHRAGGEAHARVFR